MEIIGVDHLVLTVASIERTVGFYTSVLGLRHETFGDGRHALLLGEQKVNLHEAGHEFEPKAARPTPGSADLCLVTTTPIGTVVAELGDRVIEGSVDRTGARGPMQSVYLRDPDDNLIEIASYGEETS